MYIPVKLFFCIFALLVLSWNTTGGKIVKSEDPKKMFLDTSGLEGQVVTVTVERSNGNFGRMSAACTVRILPGRP